MAGMVTASVVYLPQMADKPTVAVLSERVSNHINAAKWVVGILGTGLVGLGVTVSQLTGDVKALSKDIANVVEDLAQLKTLQAAANPLAPGSQEIARAMLNRARQDKALPVVGARWADPLRPRR